MAAADTKPIEQFWDAGPSVKNVGGYTGVLVEDSFEMTGAQSNLVGFYFENKDGNWVQKEAITCTTLADPNCLNAQNIWYNAILKVCQNDADTNCVVGVTALKDGKEIPGKFAEYYPDKNKYQFTGDLALGVPDGGLPSLWTFDGLSHQGGDKFMVYSNFFHSGGAYFGSDDISRSPHQFAAGIFAVSKEKDVKIGRAHV